MTVVEVLLNAKVNIGTVVMLTRHPIAQTALSQLENAIAALEAGKLPDDEMPEEGA